MKMFPSHLLLSLLAATLLFLAHGAVASTTFLLDLRGQATHEVDAWECYPGPCSAGDPRLQPVTFDWIGVLTLVTADDEDGIYRWSFNPSESDILSLSLDSNLEDFDRPWAATAAVAGGQIVDLDAYFENAPNTFILADMTAFYGHPHTHHAGPTHATAIVTNVPEPSTWLLMALGLGVITLARRRIRPA